MDFFRFFKALLQSDLPCAQRMIMAVMLNHADAGGRAWPSQERIATQAGLGRRAARDHLHELEALGWLSVTGHMGRNNIYRVSIPADFAASNRHSLPHDRQGVPQSENDNRQISPSQPADFSNQPADSAVQSGTFCRLTSQEPPNNYLLTSHKETARPSPGGEGELAEPRSDLDADLCLQTASGHSTSIRAAAPSDHSMTRDHQTAKAQPPTPTPKPDWREWNRRQVEEANTVASAPHMPPDFHTAWQRWQACRTRRATEARISSEAIPWTRDAAEAALRECERAANTHGWPAVIARIDQAISGGWQGLNTDKIATGPARQQIPARPSGRNDSANLAGRYTSSYHSGSANRPGRCASPPPGIQNASHGMPITTLAAAVPSAPTSPAAVCTVESEAMSGAGYFLSQLRHENETPLAGEWASAN